MSAIRTLGGDFLAQGDVVARRAALLQNNGARVAVLGDSFAALALDTTTGLNFDARSWVSWLPFHASGRIILPQSYIQGVSGQDTEGVTARVGNITALDPKPDYCYVLAGANDIVKPTRPTLAEMQGWLGAAFSALRAAGIVPVAMTLLPRSDANSLAQNQWRMALNAWLRELASDGQVLLADISRYFADSSNAVISARSYDGVHPAAPGADILGQAAWDAISHRFPKQVPLYEYGDSNLLTNPFLNGTSGTNSGTGASGSVPSNWINSQTGATDTTSAISIVASSDDDPIPWGQIDVTAGAGGIGYGRFQQNITGISIGDELRSSVEIECDAPPDSAVQFTLSLVANGWPRNNPSDVGAAEAFTDGMRYVIDRADYPSARSQAWKNIVVEGFGAIEVAAVQRKTGDIDIEIKRIPWDSLFYDPHSCEPDFSDATYVGRVLWMDFEDAVDRAVANGLDEARAREVLEATIQTAPGPGETYDDKPRYTIWADGRRKRVRIVMVWHKTARGWMYCEFTRGGKLYESLAPYVDQDGDSYCPWVLESANVDRDNNRYGEVRHLIDPQDEINKRRSKALHLLNVHGVIADDGAVDDVNSARRELARPDFWITKRPGLDFVIEKGMDLAAGQAQLGEQAMRYIAESGPNQALLGQGVSDQSGRAIEAQQAGGLVSQSDLMDTLRRLDLRVFTIVASMMKQYWTAQKWIRVTDDEMAPRWVGLNQPLLQDVATGAYGTEEEWRKAAEQGVQPMQLVPMMDEMGQPRLSNDVARLDMDIIVSDAPDTINQSGETYTAFVDLMRSGLPPPMLKLAIEMHPGLPVKRKAQLIDMLEQMTQQQGQDPMAADAARLAKEEKEAEIGDKRASAYEKLTRGEERMARLGALGAVPRPDIREAMMDAPQGPMGGPMGQPMPEGPQGPPGAPPGPPQGAPMAPPPQQPPQQPPIEAVMSGDPRMVA